MKRDFKRWEVALAGTIFLAGLALRLRMAIITYLNPDEALHALLAEAVGTKCSAIRSK